MSTLESTRSEPVEWHVSQEPIPYEDSLQIMEERVRLILSQQARECVWLLEHPPLYTAGTSTKTSDLPASCPFPVYRSGRGGQMTYHGPGQRVIYAMLNLTQRNKKDVRLYVETLENWIIDMLGLVGIKAHKDSTNIGIWVPHLNPWADRTDSLPERKNKIAAIGVRIRQWITFHGVSLNISPDLNHFSYILPCGIRSENLGITSLKALNCLVPMAECDRLLRQEFEKKFGPTIVTTCFP